MGTFFILYNYFNIMFNDIAVYNLSGLFIKLNILLSLVALYAYCIYFFFENHTIDQRDNET